MQAYVYGFSAIYDTMLRFGMVRRPQGVVNTPLNTLFHVLRLSDHRERLKAAGAMVIGKTSVPLNNGDLQTYNAVYGTTNNP